MFPLAADQTIAQMWSNGVQVVRAVRKIIFWVDHKVHELVLVLGPCCQARWLTHPPVTWVVLLEQTSLGYVHSCSCRPVQVIDWQQMLSFSWLNALDCYIDVTFLSQNQLDFFFLCHIWSVLRFLVYGQQVKEDWKRWLELLGLWGISRRGE